MEGSSHAERSEQKERMEMSDPTAPVSFEEYLRRRVTPRADLSTVGPGKVRIYSVLEFDTGARMAFVGARAVAVRSRRLLFQSGPATLDLEITGVAGHPGLLICGHIYSRTGESASEVRFEQPEHQYIVTIDRRGEFQMDSLRRGEYAIAVEFDQWVMTFPGITL